MALPTKAIHEVAARTLKLEIYIQLDAKVSRIIKVARGRLSCGLGKMFS